MSDTAPPSPTGGRILLAALAVLLVLVTLTARPWERTVTALRPDTGTQATSLGGEALNAVLTTLLTRIYGAFGQEEEGAIYDGLATAVASDLLTDLYLQRRLAQVTAPPETAGSAEITDVTLNEMVVLGRQAGTTQLRATWTVTGTLGHEDHQHERVNRYTADLTVGAAQGEWRLTAFDLDRVQREDVAVYLDPFE